MPALSSTTVNLTLVCDNCGKTESTSKDWSANRWPDLENEWRRMPVVRNFYIETEGGVACSEKCGHALGMGFVNLLWEQPSNMDLT